MNLTEDLEAKLKNLERSTGNNMARRTRGQTKKYSLPDQVKVNTPEKERKFKQKKFREKTEALGGKVKYMDEFNSGGRVNTRRMNRLEELGRVDAEKAFTKKGARNLRDEKKRIVGELKKAKGGKVLKKVKPHQKGLKKLPTKVRNKMGYMKKGGRVGMGKAMRGGGCVR